jgi:hypothetical protein
MAVQLVTTIQNFIGESGDVKPTSTATNRIPVGSEFYESDTFKTYVYDGTDWHEKV